MPRNEQLSLGAFIHPAGHHVAAWRHPQVAPDPLDIQQYIQIAKTAERACFDMLFFSDSLAVFDSVEAHKMARSNYFEPVTLLASLAAVTQHIGLIATATTSYNQPYHIARQFASLDHLSGGRAGWNLVTSDAANEAANFNRHQHFSHQERYLRAAEFYRVVEGLWNSWEDDAFIYDKASGQTYRPEKMHPLHHRGDYFQVSGPLNIARSPQGKPVVVQAGSSEAGKALAAKTADLVFTAQSDLKKAKEFYQDVRQRLSACQRPENSLKIMPGVLLVTGQSRQEAEEKYQQFQQLVQPEVGIALLGRMLGNFDLSGYPQDQPLPELPLSDSGQQSRQALLRGIAASENLTLAELGLRIAGGRGHHTVIGTAQQIADELQCWFEEYAADGFNIMVPHLPAGLDDIARTVIPELQRRGLFRKSYQGKTLRSHLGLTPPPFHPPFESQ
ncbi:MULTISPECIES: LLM class flavin-dependent oxidoreductase [unclassified Tatumella]|uniref:LLM class flavin-dependent oxidoreductase n=1 Tax=unclassified Tatumella TaxID=2649542 RepID=UPI001BB00609|nr:MULTISPECIES: LLM class flavin-dependent oxidoreductase [unclassified Tatumella]MBS0877736.1 LLM class flavin-dependent oxidoreductase [Tatumella sp. JGM82]MBS0891475.1 LLM class flavin-dependent oxidoreductase [Tatumella sp. JGM94]MBS0902371.1 LLM class flavin-dependent oxidoreductase [Tatumella sp. JGM100]